MGFLEGMVERLPQCLRWVAPRAQLLQVETGVPYSGAW